VIAYLPRMFDELRGTLALVTIERLEIRRERSLRIHDDRLASRQPDDDVRTDASVLRRDSGLLGEVAVFGEPCELDDTTQLNLAPVAAHVRLTQRLDEGPGLASQRREPKAKGSDLLVQPGGRGDAIAFDFAEFAVHLLERVGDRTHQFRDRLLSLLEIGGRSDLILAK